ncbi:MAG: SRPBCC family protein [Halobacteriaceae archaeon]
MREVTASRFVSASPAAVERTLSPARLVEYEGSFRVADVAETGTGTRVTATGGGIELVLRVCETDAGYEYVQEGGPLETLSTTLTWRAEDHGTRVQMRSQVAFGYPPAALTDRLAAWKRRGELRRALSALAADVA